MVNQAADFESNFNADNCHADVGLDAHTQRMSTSVLLGALLRSSKAAILQDGMYTDANEMNEQAELLSRELVPFRGHRVVLVSPSANHILIALAAAELAQCSIVLYRGGELPHPLEKRWGVAAILGSSLDVRRSGWDAASETQSYVYMPTSGTTGEPKLVQQTMGALLGRIRRQNHLKERPRWLFTYHPATFGGLQVLLTALSDAADLITVSQPSVSALCEAALVHRVTHISGTPTFWRAFVMGLGEKIAELNLRQITLGGEIADEAVLLMLRSKFPDVAIRHIYASTEAGSLFSVRDGRAGFPAEWLKTGVDGVRLRILEGVLQVQSPRAMAGYATPAPSVLTEDGWLITGDQVEHVGDRVHFRGRQDSVLNVGGAKVKPEEVEEVILQMQEVMDAYVYGVRNPITGMVVGADIVPRSRMDESELRHVIAARLQSVLEPYKIPRLIRIVDSLTLSASGKKKKTE